MLQMLLLRAEKKHAPQRGQHDQEVKTSSGLSWSSKPNQPCQQSPSRLNWPSPMVWRKNSANRLVTAWAKSQVTPKLPVGSYLLNRLIVARIIRKNCLEAGHIQYKGFEQVFTRKAQLLWENKFQKAFDFPSLKSGCFYPKINFKAGNQTCFYIYSALFTRRLGPKEGASKKSQS